MNQEIFDTVSKYTDEQHTAYFIGWANAHGFNPTAEQQAEALAVSKEAIAKRITEEAAK